MATKCASLWPVMHCMSSLVVVFKLTGALIFVRKYRPARLGRRC